MAENEKACGKYWELLKFQLRKLLMETGAKLKKKEKKKEENNLIAELISLSSMLPENMSEIQRAHLQTLQLKLVQLHISKAKGAFIRSKAKWLEQRVSLFFQIRETKAK